MVAANVVFACRRVGGGRIGFPPLTLLDKRYGRNDVRILSVLPIVVALGVGLAAVPAVAGNSLQPTSNATVLAFLTGHGVTAQSKPEWQLAECKKDGSPCKAGSDCCSGACKDAGEGQTCVPK